MRSRIGFIGKTLGLWLVGALAIAIPLSNINLVRFYRLRQTDVAATGMVADLQSENHQSVYYSYEALGKSYSGIGRAGFGNPKFSSLTVGKPLIVYYLPNAPWVSCAGLPRQLVENEVPPIALAGLTFPFFAIAIYGWRYPRFRRWLLGSSGRP
jgi:hypothetical protein